MSFATGNDSRFFCLICETHISMDNKTRKGHIPAERVREAFSELAEIICSGHERINLSLSGNSFTLHLEGATVNITVSERPAAQKGGQK